MSRLNGGAWELLPTRFDGVLNGHACYRVECDGFLPFAIIANPALPMTTLHNGTPDFTGLGMVPDYHETADPVTTRQTLSPPVDAPAPDREFPYPGMALGLAGCGGVIAGGYAVRRWYLHHQSPALFRNEK